MAEEEDLLGAKIGRLLRVTARNGCDASADARQLHDRQRLQQLSVATTSIDTLVIVRFPVGDFVDCDGYKWETKEFFMDSRQLLATGSSVFAAQLLSPEVQAQTRRRLDYDSKSHPHAKFVLDLTPPIEGVESASLVARMSLSDGLRDWWRSSYVSSVSRCLVSGHDDVCPSHFDLFLSGDDSDVILGPPMTISKLEYPEPRKIVDYCPIRHRAAILRLLMAIRQGDLVLDSAPRTATIIVIAKYFDCVKVVKDSVLAWFTSDPNQEFIQVNAEDALWMGWMVGLRSVTRVAFGVLVVERAVEILDNKRAVNNKQQPSVLGRTRASVADEQETCIQHAAQKLAQRAGTLYAQLMSDDVNTYLGITHWPASSPALCLALRLYIRKLVSNAMSDACGWDGDNECIDSAVREYDRIRARYVPIADLVPTKEIYLGLSPQQSLLTCVFWRRFSELASVPEKLDSHIKFHIPKVSQSPNGTELVVPQSEAQQSPVIFDRDAFYSEFLAAILDLSAKWTDSELEINIPKNSFLVLSLSNEEFKFLPLWAGGLDDGTGGIYQPVIPDAEHGPIGPGPGFWTGETIPDDRSSTVTDGDHAATILTGADTISMTSGRSIRPAPSQATGLDDELAAATAGGQLTTADSNVQEDASVPKAAQTTTTASDGFDWTIGASGDQDSDFDSDADDYGPDAAAKD
ncbi:hypothetical protein F4801DRAFT_46732 [Xylaria longipes]|nr:hypothetical protein F4801DRAFT_46732 [Xylaria longipes]RYC62557.1 hypothetical protein CHU98_g3666 [Xylaria longipes]